MNATRGRGGKGRTREVRESGFTVPPLAFLSDKSPGERSFGQRRHSRGSNDPTLPLWRGRQYVASASTSGFPLSAPFHSGQKSVRG